MNDKNSPVYIKGPEQTETPEAFEHIKADEFPHRASLLDINRRDLLKFMGGTLALAGLAQGCRFLPQQKIVPFVQAPEDRLPGSEVWYASTATIGGYGTGIIVKQFEGRPIKIEGNPVHPASLGKSDSRLQAELAVMYDPDRLKSPIANGEPSSWDEFFKVTRAAMTKVRGGAGVAILTPNVSSPSLFAQISDFLRANPLAKWYQYEPVGRDNVHDGSVMAFGQPVETVYDFSKADVVVTLDSDYFLNEPGNIRYMHDTAAKRAIDDHAPSMNRIYAIESSPTLVGAMADHRYRVRASKILDVCAALASAVGVAGATGNPPAGVTAKDISAIAKDLLAQSGRAVVVAGSHMPASVHALVHAVNAAIGAVGTTVSYIAPVMAKPVNNMAEIKDLTTAMQSGQVSTLLVMGGNPVLDAPVDAKFAEALTKVPLTAHLSLYQNETTHKCLWALPESHFLEAWGDATAHDGTVSIVQPLINPIYDSKSCIQMLDHLLGRARPDLDIVQRNWRGDGLSLGKSFEDQWAEILAAGIDKQAPKTMTVTPVSNLATALSPVNGGDTELVILPDPNIYDGRYANLGWLQELPKPLTNLTWDNTFQMSPATAKKFGVGQKDKMLGVQYYGNWDIVKVTANGQTVEGPVYVHYGMADDVIVAHLGYGREVETMTVAKKGDMIHNGGGFDAYPFRTTENPWIIGGATVEKTGRDYKLANTQFHNLLDVTEIDSKRDIIRETTLKTYKEEHHVLQHPTTPTVHEEGEEVGKESIWISPPEFYDTKTNYQWAMTIDLNLCTGCNACVTACQAENNIPTVGKEQVLRHRMLHWIRIDRYYRKDGDVFDESDPRITFQPMTCQHCEKAPCEPVCPVAATTHSHEGLNQMVYNRCVGTRYCSNNCPYKVRRFNYLHYTKKVEDVPVLKLLQNPDVTVRGRGVMEKCTYCVQRINHARIQAKKEDRKIKDGEVVTACQQACPTNTIVFGNISDPESMVNKTRASNRNYTVLQSLNTRPRTTYLGKVRNPNPELEA